MAIVDGYRLLLRDSHPGVPFQGRPVTDYCGSLDGIVTEPSSGTVEHLGGMIVTRNLHCVCRVAAWCDEPVGDIPARMTVIACTWEDADVVATSTGGTAVGGPFALVGGEIVGTPHPPVPYVRYKVTALVAGDELTREEILAASNDISLQVA